MSAVRALCLWLFAFIVLIGVSTTPLFETGCGSTGKAAFGTTGGTGGGGTGGAGSGSSSGSGGGTGVGPNVSAQQFLYVAAGSGVSGWTISQDSSLNPISGSPFAVGGAGVIADPTANFVFSVGGTSPSNTALNTNAVNSDGSLKTSSTFSDSTLMGGMSINPSGTALYVASISAAQANTGWKIYAVQSDGSVKFISGPHQPRRRKAGFHFRRHKRLWGILLSPRRQYRALHCRVRWDLESRDRTGRPG